MYFHLFHHFNTCIYKNICVCVCIIYIYYSVDFGIYLSYTFAWYLTKNLVKPTDFILLCSCTEGDCVLYNIHLSIYFANMSSGFVTISTFLITWNRIKINQSKHYLNKALIYATKNSDSLVLVKMILSIKTYYDLL